MKKIESKHYCFNIHDLNISPEQVEEQAKMDENMPSYSSFLLEEMNTNLSQSEIKGGYSILPANVGKDTIKLANQHFNTGESIASKFTNSKYIAVFTCTAGPQISTRIVDLNKNGLFLEAYLLDTLGSILVETAMDKIQELLEKEYDEKGLKITNRYSPGYSNWNVEEQQKLFKLLPHGFCGVHLSESSLMSPVKSISGFIGIGAEVRFQKHDCIECFSDNCIFRNSTKHCKSI